MKTNDYSNGNERILYLVSNEHGMVSCGNGKITNDISKAIYFDMIGDAIRESVECNKRNETAYTFKIIPTYAKL